MIISKSQIKKNLKKIEKIKLRLTNKNGIIFSDEPTDIIVIANAGLANDVKRQELEFSLSNYTKNIKEIITLSNLTFSILICIDSTSGAEILNSLQSFTISTPNFPLRPTVNAFCMYAKDLPANITSEAVDFNSSKPPGLTIIDEFITVDEESFLINYFMNLQATETSPNAHLKHRTVLHFGYEFNYDTNKSDVSKPLTERPIPNCCLELIDRYERLTNKAPRSLNQLTVNIYSPGDGIPPHTDTHSGFGDEIVSISLESHVTIEWTLPAPSAVCMATDIAPRSLLVMSDESRYLWRHAIASRHFDPVQVSATSWEHRARARRLSLTFRSVLTTAECRCRWAAVCDSPRTGSAPEDPVTLERRFVHQVYEAIAPHFSATRHRMWPRVRQFIERCLATVPGAVGADLGCGNGKYFPAMLGSSGRAAGTLLAADSSFNLCHIASTSVPAAPGHVAQAHCLALPFRSGCCDYAISIAVIHHLGSEERRRLALVEMARLLRPGGLALVYVWARQQRDKDGRDSAYVASSTKRSGKSKPVANGGDAKPAGAPLPVHENRTEFAANDMLVPWTTATPKQTTSAPGQPEAAPQTYSRYYHVFEEGELEQLCQTVPGTAIVEGWYDSGNWAVVFEKLS